MRVDGKPKLLKQLLDESQSKGNRRLPIDRIVHSQKVKEVHRKALLQGLADTYLLLDTSKDSNYAGTQWRS